MALIVYTVYVPVSFSGVKVKGEENVLMALIITITSDTKMTQSERMPRSDSVWARANFLNPHRVCAFRPQLRPSESSE